MLILSVDVQCMSLLIPLRQCLNSEEKLAAHVAACNVSNILYLAGTGAQKATAALIGGGKMLDIYMVTLLV